MGSTEMVEVLHAQSHAFNLLDVVAQILGHDRDSYFIHTLDSLMDLDGFIWEGQQYSLDNKNNLDSRKDVAEAFRQAVIESLNRVRLRAVLSTLRFEGVFPGMEIQIEQAVGKFDHAMSALGYDQARDTIVGTGTISAP